jgi:nitrogen regulatory protein PII
MDKQVNEPAINQPFYRMTLILSEHQCQKCERIAKKEGISDGIVLLGRGTVKSATLNLLGLKSQKREVVYMLLEKEKAEELLDVFTEELQLDKAGHGIAFTTPVVIADQIIGKKQDAPDTAHSMEGESMFKKLTVVVNRGMAEDVMEIARKSGVTGGTILHGRGTGSEFAAKLLGMEIEPEKELVIMLMPSDLIEKVVGDLYEELQMDTPGNGILFVEPISDVRGIIDSKHTKSDG